MASGFGTFTSSSYFTSGNGRGYLRAWVSQSVDSTNRTVKITVDAYLSYYRNGGGNWNPGTSNLFYNHSSGNYIKATVDGSTNTSGQNLGLKGNSKTLNVGSYYTTRDGAVAANTVAYQSKSATFNYNSNGDAITKSWSASIKYGSTTMSVSGNVTTDSISAAYTPPQGLSVSVNEIKDESVVLDVSVTSGGNPSEVNKVHLYGTILSGSTYGPPYRYVEDYGSLSATQEITNYASGTSSFKIKGNTEYYYGALAGNTAANSSVVSGTVVTLPAYIKDVVTSDSGGVTVLSLVHEEEGSAQTVINEYSYDGSNWVAVQEVFRIALEKPTLMYFRRENNSGTTPVFSKTIRPKNICKIYGSVNGVSKKPHTLYGSVNGQSKKIKKLYASVNGRSKLIFVDRA